MSADDISEGVLTAGGWAYFAWLAPGLLWSSCGAFYPVADIPSGEFIWTPVLNLVTLIPGLLYPFVVATQYGSDGFFAVIGLFVFWAAIFPLLMVGIGYAIFAPIIAAENRAAAAERAAHEAAAASARARAERLALLKKLKQMILSARADASSLSMILGEATLHANRAEDELSGRRPSLFWTAMEEAVASLGEYQDVMGRIESTRSNYGPLAATVGNDAPTFRLDVVLPDPTHLHLRLNQLNRQAQELDRFPEVYELRRNTTAVVRGFRSLGEAIEEVGGRIVDRIGEFSNSLDCRLESLESSLQSSAVMWARQTEVLRAELQNTRQSARDGNEALLNQLSHDANASAERERLPLRMLDNLQRHRPPTIFERP